MSEKSKVKIQNGYLLIEDMIILPKK